MLIFGMTFGALLDVYPSLQVFLIPIGLSFLLKSIRLGMGDFGLFPLLCLIYLSFKFEEYCYFSREGCS